MGRNTIAVTGMSCGGCEQNVESSLLAVDGVDSVQADHETDTVEVKAADTVSEADLAAAVQDAGYEVAR